jgi:hypothetical protein
MLRVQANNHLTQSTHDHTQQPNNQARVEKRKTKQNRSLVYRMGKKKGEQEKEWA